MDTPITRAEHEEFRKRIEDENTRQNKRIEVLESGVLRIEALHVSIEKLALNMESMMKEQAMQGQRLEQLESKDGERWRMVVGYTITAVIGIVIGFIFKQIGM